MLPVALSRALRGDEKFQAGKTATDLSDFGKSLMRPGLLRKVMTEVVDALLEPSLRRRRPCKAIIVR